MQEHLNALKSLCEKQLDNNDDFNEEEIHFNDFLTGFFLGRGLSYEEVWKSGIVDKGWNYLNFT